MNNLVIFENKEFGEVRWVSVDGVPYAVASDIAKTLGYKNVSESINNHCRWVEKCYIPHPQSKNKEIEVNIINEGDIYRLIFNSKLESAQKFESWVVDEVLPSIRQNGSYSLVNQECAVSVVEKDDNVVVNKLINTIDNITNKFMESSDTMVKSFERNMENICSRMDRWEDKIDSMNSKLNNKLYLESEYYKQDLIKEEMYSATEVAEECLILTQSDDEEGNFNKQFARRFAISQLGLNLEQELGYCNEYFIIESFKHGINELDEVKKNIRYTRKFVDALLEHLSCMANFKEKEEGYYIRFTRVGKIYPIHEDTFKYYMGSDKVKSKLEDKYYE